MFDTSLESVSSEEGYNNNRFYDNREESSASSSSSEDAILAHHAQFMATVATPLSCHNPHHHHHKKDKKNKKMDEEPLKTTGVATTSLDSRRRDNHGRWASALEATPLECGHCPEGKAKAKKKQEEEERRMKMMQSMSLNSLPVLFDMGTRKELEKMSAQDFALVQQKSLASASQAVPELRLSYQQPITPPLSTLSKSVFPKTVTGKLPPVVQQAPRFKERVLPPLLTEAEYKLSQALPSSTLALSSRSLPPMQKITKATTLTSTSKTTPAPVLSMDSAFVERMATQNKYTQRVESMGMKSLLMGNQFQPMVLDKKKPGTYCPDESREAVLAHIKHCHYVFYSLLERNGIVEDIVNEARDFLYVVPTKDTLATIPKQTYTTEATNKLLRYHIIKVEPMFDLRTVRDSRDLETLMDEKTVTLEYREETDGMPAGHYIGGLRVMHDEVKPGHIAVIRGVLDDSVPEPVVTSLPPPSNAPGEADAPVDAGADAPTDAPPDLPADAEAGEPATVKTLTATKNYMGSVGRLTDFKQQSLKTLVEKMNASNYSSSATTVSPLQRASVKPVDIVLRLYNTDSLFKKYGANRLADINPVTLSQRHSMQFTASQQRQVALGTAVKMTEYTVGAQHRIQKADMMNGIVELCFTNPARPGEATLLMTKIQEALMETNTYMTDNEHVLLRFQDQLLHTILINHSHGMAVCEKTSLSGNHFFELFVGTKARAALVAGLDRQAFDSALLLHGSMRERVRRAGGAANRRLSKFLALKVMAASGKPVDLLTAEINRLAAAHKFPDAGLFTPELKISVQFIDAKYKNRSASETVNATRFSTAPFDLFELEAFNGLFVKMTRAVNRYVKLGPTSDDPFFLRMTLDIGAVDLLSRTWMARDDKHVYVLWASASSISYIAILERKSKWAQGL